MAKQVGSHSEMAQARHTDGLNVIFDQKSPSGSTHSRSQSVSSSASSCSADSSPRRRGAHRGRYRSSSSSSSSTSSGSSFSSRSRSRSYPRCHRRSSRCRCDDHSSRRRYRARSRSYSRSPPRRYRAGSRSYSRSPPRRYGARSRSYSRSPPRRNRAHSRSYSPPERYSRHRRYYRSRSRSPRRWDGRRRPAASMLRCRFSRSPSRTYRGRSRSRSTGRSVSLSLRDKRELLEAAQANAMKMLGVEKLDLPESVKPILSKKPEARISSPEPPLRAEQSSKITELQGLSSKNIFIGGSAGQQHLEDAIFAIDTEPEPVMSSPKMSPKSKIAFSENNFVAKPTVVPSSAAKVTPRVDSIESRKPYGHWIPIGSGRNSTPH